MIDDGAFRSHLSEAERSLIRDRVLTHPGPERMCCRGDVVIVGSTRHMLSCCVVEVDQIHTSVGNRPFAE